MNKVKLEDIMGTFNCDREQAKDIRDLVERISVEAIDEDIEKREVPF